MLSGHSTDLSGLTFGATAAIGGEGDLCEMQMESLTLDRYSTHSPSIA